MHRRTTQMTSQPRMRAGAVVTIAVFALTTITTPPSQAASLTPAKAVAKLVVKGRGPKTGYTRAKFGAAWKDVDHNGCDTRNDVMRRDFLSVVLASNGCTVMGGTWIDPYTGVHYTFGHRPSEVQGDHVVSLSDAWQKGAARWTTARRTQFANDPLNVVMTIGAVNGAKSDHDAASWLPPDKSHRCKFIARQVAVKYKYKVSVTSAEKRVMTTILKSAACKRTKLPSAKSRAR